MVLAVKTGPAAPLPARLPGYTHQARPWLRGRFTAGAACGPGRAGDRRPPGDRTWPGASGFRGMLAVLPALACAFSDGAADCTPGLATRRAAALDHPPVRCH